MSDFLSNEYNAKLKIVKENMQKLNAIGVIVDKNILNDRRSVEDLEEVNHLFLCNYHFYIKIFNKCQRIKNRMQHFRKEQIQSTGIELLNLLLSLNNLEKTFLLNEKIVKELSILFYDCMKLEICYEGTHILFDLLVANPFVSIEELIKKDMNKDDFVIQNDLNEKVMFFLGEKKAISLKENYMLQMSLYENLNKEYDEQEKKETSLKIKSVKKSRNKVWLQQWKRRIFGLFCLGIVNLGIVSVSFETEKNNERVIEESTESIELYSIESFLLSHHFLLSEILIFDLLVAYMFNRKIRFGPLGKNREIFQKSLDELEQLREVEGKERKKIYERLVEYRLDLIQMYEMMPESIKEDNELNRKVHLLEKEVTRK